MPRFECPKCLGGKGLISAFSHVRGGVCFKCGGSGFVEQKSAPKKSLEFKFSFLWLNPDSANFRNGDFCYCFKRKARSMNAAKKIAAEVMARNGSSDFKFEQVE